MRPFATLPCLVKAGTKASGWGVRESLYKNRTTSIKVLTVLPKTLYYLVLQLPSSIVLASFPHRHSLVPLHFQPIYDLTSYQCTPDPSSPASWLPSSPCKLPQSTSHATLASSHSLTRQQHNSTVWHSSRPIHNGPLTSPHSRRTPLLPAPSSTQMQQHSPRPSTMV